MRNNKGVSVVELVIVLIIMILLISFAVYSGSGSIEKAEATELYEEINSMHVAVNGIMMQKIMGDYDDAWLSNYYNKDLSNGWYEVIATNELTAGEVDLSDKYEMDYIRRTYWINFETGEVMLAKPIEVLGVEVRSYQSIRNLVESDKISLIV